MKKLLLLISMGVVYAAHAQQRPPGVMFNDNADRAATSAQTERAGASATRGRLRSSGGSARTSSTPTSRWYKYTDYFAANYTTAVSGTYLWNDTTSVDVYTGTSGNEYLFNTIVSVGLVCDPFVAGWNDPLAYPGEMELTTSSAYMIDTVYIHGSYYRNDAKPDPVDTLKLAVIYGDGTLSSDLHAVARDTVNGNEWIYTQYGVDTLHYIRMPYDSVDNRADTFQGGVTPVLSQLLLKNVDTALNYEAYIPMAISVPAGGNMPALSLTFKSGDASFTFGDTVFTGVTGALYKYGMFRPACIYQTSGGTTATFPANSALDQNQGQFRYGGYNAPHHIYTPQWFWTSGAGGAAQLQYPDFAFHISCATCNVGTKNLQHAATGASAVPNPVNNQVSINFTLASAADVSVSLTNIMGQTVAIENMTNVSNGTAVINTSAMPVGVYFYAVVANGARKTGTVVIAH